MTQSILGRGETGHPGQCHLCHQTLKAADPVPKSSCSVYRMGGGGGDAATPESPRHIQVIEVIHFLVVV